MSEQEKIYAPVSATQITFQSGKKILKLGIPVEKLKAFLEEHRNEKGYVNLGVSERKSKGKFGETHTVWLDTWKPDFSKARQPGEPYAKPNADKAPTDENDDLPF